MNNLFRGSLFTVVILFTLISFSAGAAKYYVVIGAFAKESNARKYTGYARNFYLDAYYKFCTERNMYYVHVMTSAQKEEARNWALYIQHETKFKDAWVYTDLTGEERSLNEEGVVQKGTSPRYTPNELHADMRAGVSTAGWQEFVAENTLESSEAAWTNIEEISYLRGIKNVINFKENIPGVNSKLFTFIAETTEGKRVPTEVMLVNYEKAKKLSSFSTGEYIAFRGKRKNQKLTLVCDVLGYSEVIRTVDLDKLKMSGDMKQNKEGVWEVRFKLSRMKKNEISIMHNTIFYQDAAVLLPSSKKQVDELLTLMKGHPSYKILLHSHCNSGSKRVIKLAGDNNGYFDIERSLEKSGSDKQLTKQRAETIRTYLVDNGIDKKRIDVMAWGSIDMLVKPKSADVALNERVEIEILEN